MTPETITTLFTSLGLPTGLVGILLWFHFHKEKRNDERQDKFEEVAWQREERLSQRVTHLETQIHTELIDVCKSSVQTQAEIAAALKGLTDRVETSDNNTKQLINELLGRPCMLETERQKGNLANG